MNTINKNSPVPSLALAAFLTGMLIGGGWVLSANIRWQSGWVYLLLAAGFVLSAGRPRRMKVPETFFTPTVAGRPRF